MIKKYKKIKYHTVEDLKFSIKRRKEVIWEDFTGGSYMHSGR
jgi:hypothetical protein